ncbi:cytochrome C biogenesis protein [Wenjunlia vitaminophila]|uniref:Cytochrome C biogenesis protein n=1 Tax=Wenjunlia vitaminophila TaxID=76728 RepID=A0A0T6LY05_WENVI|nr:cytochrome c biogenesis protein ResB [Wenjunlia vitaminophila]KRV50909.1 cytochrome C biogenesis protein [Wenjunlia vitaminophila]
MADSTRTATAESGAVTEQERDDELLQDAERLSSAPREEDPGEGPGPVGIGLVGWLRWFWRQLTSMRVALLLLFLLSIAAIPGSLVPQEGTSEGQFKVLEFKEQHPTLGPLYDRLGLFDVYSSAWFSAIYILLFVSLAGCILPRSWQFFQALRSRPPAAPRNLSRLPVHTTWETAVDRDEVLAAATRILKRRRFRAHLGDGAVAAEKGYLREAGNLVFHISLFGLLVAVALGHLFSASGNKLVVEGDGFANSLTQYDDFSSGPLYDDEADLDAFGFTLDDFRSAFEESGSQRGTARKFEADLTYWTGDGERTKKTTIKVNSPLKVGGTKIYLVGFGYAPVVTVRDGQGQVAYQGPVACLPQDANTTSTCVIKVPDYVDENGKKTQLGFTGTFVPTFGGATERGMVSQFPSLKFPALFLTAYRGDLGIDSGLPQNVYQLKTKNMKQFKKANGDPFAKYLLPEEKMELPGGAGTLEFTGIKEYAQFEVSEKPGKGLALASASLALLGLICSLFVQRRRVWVRATPTEGGGTVVSMAGLARSESAKIAEELADIAVELHDDAEPSRSEKE